MKRVTLSFLTAVLLAGLPGFSATQAFAQVALGPAGARVPITTVGGPILPVAPGVQGTVPGRGSTLVTMVGQTGLILPATIVPTAVLPIGSSSDRPLAGSSKGPLAGALQQTASPGSLAIGRSAIATTPGRGTADVAEAARAPRANDDEVRVGAGTPTLRAQAENLEDVAAPKPSVLTLRSREDARFDGTAPLSDAQDSLAPEPDKIGGWSRPSGLFAPQASAALPGGPGGVLPPAPGKQPAPAAASPRATVAPAASFQLPFSLSLPTKLYVAAHGLGLVTATAALIIGLGWAALGGAALVGGGVAWRLSRLPPLPSEPLVLEPAEQDALRAQVADTLDGLLARMGLDSSSRPKIELSNDWGPENAVALGSGLGPQATIRVGEGLLFRPPEHLEGMLAHELGHLVRRDNTFGRRLRGAEMMAFGLGLYRYVAAWAVAMAGAGSLWQWAYDITWSASSAVLAGAGGLAAVLAGYVILYAAFLFGVAASRLQELAADRFAAFVDGPEKWLASLEHSLARDGRAVKDWWKALHAHHPSFEERIRRLRTYRQ